MSPHPEEACKAISKDGGVSSAYWTYPETPLCGSSGRDPLQFYAAARFETERTPSLNSFTKVVTASTVREVARS